jgi:uncharacterized protein (TIGR00299 family) protein
MKIAYFDLIAGASGDMILGALIDAGLSLDVLRYDLSVLDLNEFHLTAKKVDKNGFSATKVDVLVQDKVPERHLPQIESIITSSNLSEEITEQAITIFRQLGKVEAKIHDTSLDQVHLHELGGVDTIVDVVGVILGLKTLGIEKVVVSPFPLGRGFIKGAHGQIPLPAPATLALLKGVPILGIEIDAELVTPTGAVLLTSLADTFGEIPPMKLESIGYGAGGRDLPIPNLLRVIIGESTPSEKVTIGSYVMLETNIDDLNPEVYPYVMEQLFKSGALDVFLTPIQMKKNRPGTMLQVLAGSKDVPRLRKIIFEETTTLGIRQHSIERWALERESREILTPYGIVRVKIAQLGGGKSKVAPEFEDCRKLAVIHEVPIREVYFAALSELKGSATNA